MIKLKEIMEQSKHITVYHGTKRGTDISNIDYQKLSRQSLLSGFGIHFGTRKAAEQIIKAKNFDCIQSFNLDISKIAAIDNPIKEEEFAYALYRKSKQLNHTNLPDINEIKSQPLGVMSDYYKNNPIFYKESVEADVKDLKKSGFTGIAYRNKTEDAGSISYVVFDSSIYQKVGEECKGEN